MENSDYSLVEKHIFMPRFASMGAKELKTILLATYLSRYSEETRPSAYILGRKLGLTAGQLRSYENAANLLLESLDDTKHRAKRQLALAIENGAWIVGADGQTLVIQVDDDITFHYVSSKLVEAGVVRQADVKNGHLAMPVAKLDVALEAIDPEIQLAPLHAEVQRLLPPDFPADEGESGYEKFSRLLADAANAVTAARPIVDALGLILKSVC